MPQLTRDEILSEIRKLDTWRHRITLSYGVVTPGREDCTKEMERLGLPIDLTGVRVLDIGCSDGFYCFECEKRGADVLGIDDFTTTPPNGGNYGFAIAKKILRSNVRFIKQSVYDLCSETIGSFDIVLCLNVLYHLRHPMLALEIIHSLLRPHGVMYLKSYFHQDVRFSRWGLDLSKRPKMRFFEDDELNDDPSNWWAPNRYCLEAMLRATSFSNMKHLGTYGNRIYYQCQR